MTIADKPVRGPISEVVAYFLRLGLLGFGGPVALVGLMQHELVVERKWLGPGPLAIHVGIYVSYLRAGFGGPGRAAG